MSADLKLRKRNGNWGVGKQSKRRQGLTLDELIQRLQKLAEPPSDPEEAHVQADEALLEYINDPRVTEAFEAIEKWYA